MKRLLYVFILLVSLYQFSGCASGDMLGNNISVSSASGLFIPDSLGNVNMDLSFDIPKNYFSNRSRIIMVPQLIVNKKVEKECSPIVVESHIYSKKMNRKKVVEKYTDPYDSCKSVMDNTSRRLKLEYHDEFSVPDSMDIGQVRVIVTTDGCGECTGFDTLHVAYVKKEINPDFVLRPKVFTGEGTAHLQFVINKYDINPELGKNSMELESMVDKLRPLLADSLVTVDSITIYGVASADGSYLFNEKLAYNRAESAKEWLIKALNINPELQNIIITDSKPEGWWPVYKAMVDDGHPDSVKVKQVLDRYNDGNDDLQERYIRRLSCWKDIRRKYLPIDRKVDYMYRYTVRSYTTDAELLSMYRVRPETFNEEEMLRVAQLVNGDSAKAEVYRKVLYYFPQSVVAANNLEVIYLRNNSVDETFMLDRNRKHILFHSKTEKGVKTASALIGLLNDIEVPEAQYSLGLIKAKQGKLQEAYRLLESYADLNSAILALCLNMNSEAKDIMDKLDDVTPKAEYIRALIAARMGNEKEFCIHRKNYETDIYLRERAEKEPDFENFLK